MQHDRGRMVFALKSCSICQGDLLIRMNGGLICFDCACACEHACARVCMHQCRPNVVRHVLY